MSEAALFPRKLPLIFDFSVSDPDPYWIRIQSDHWIRIRNLNTDPDPDPELQFLIKKNLIFFFSCYFFSIFGH
jgi:hypothetical protein